MLLQAAGMKSAYLAVAIPNEKKIDVPAEKNPANKINLKTVLKKTKWHLQTLHQLR